MEISEQYALGTQAIMSRVERELLFHEASEFARFAARRTVIAMRNRGQSAHRAYRVAMIIGWAFEQPRATPATP